MWGLLQYNTSPMFIPSTIQHDNVSPPNEHLSLVFWLCTSVGIVLNSLSWWLWSVPSLDMYNNHRQILPYAGQHNPQWESLTDRLHALSFLIQVAAMPGCLLYQSAFRPTNKPRISLTGTIWIPLMPTWQIHWPNYGRYSFIPPLRYSRELICSITWTTWPFQITLRHICRYATQMRTLPVTR